MTFCLFIHLIYDTVSIILVMSMNDNVIVETNKRLNRIAPKQIKRGFASSDGTRYAI